MQDRETAVREKIRVTRLLLKELEAELSDVLWEKGKQHDDPKIDKYLRSCYSGRDLIKRHKLDEEGVWNIFGEDSNPDLGGSHNEPFIAQVTGKLENVLNYAVHQEKFWTWGGGGRITKALVKDPITV